MIKQITCDLCKKPIKGTKSYSLTTHYHLMPLYSLDVTFNICEDCLSPTEEQTDKKKRAKHGTI